MPKPQPPNNTACREPLGRTAPAEAFRFAADLTVAAGEADGAGVPITIRARSPRPTQHAFWGLVVHDMAGMILDKPTIPLDYCHDCDDVLGFADKFDVGNDGLDVTGQLIPYVAGDRASEVIFKNRAGVPYQGSINFAGDGIQLEFIGDGQVAQVNGYQLAGPATIIRTWPLRGVAICPYGVDAGTEVLLKSANQIPFTYLTKERPPMPSKQTAAPAAETPIEAVEDKNTPAAVEIPAASADINAAPAAETPAADPQAAVETPAPAAAGHLSGASRSTELAAPGQKYLDAFGEAGAMYFAQGKTFEEAQALFSAKTAADLAAAKAELAEVKKQFSALRGETEPVSFQPEQTAEQKRAAQFAAKGSNDNVSKIAAAIKIPGRN